MKKVMLFLKMLVIYPVLFLNSLRVLKSDFDQTYSLFKSWTKTYLKIIKVKPELIRADLIPLENGFLFIANHENAIDALVLVEALPVRTNFLFDTKEKIPYMNVWIKRIRSLWFDRSTHDFTSLIDPFNQTLKDSDNLCAFRTSLNGLAMPSSFLDLAYQSQITLIPVKIKGSRSAFTKIAFQKVRVEIGLPLHYEEYGSTSPDDCLNELDLRIDAL